MGNFSKWIGGGLGWVFGGPLGAIVGFFIGSIIDNQGERTTTRIGSGGRATTPGGFVVAMLVLTAAIMKADGKVRKPELDYVKQFFVHSFGVEEAKEAILMLRDILKQNIPVDDVCRQISANMDKPTRLQLYNFLFGIAQADGEVHPQELLLLEHIAQKLGLTANEYKSARSTYIPNVDWAYEMLEIDRKASDDEVRKAYKRMAIKYHPDKVEYLGEDFKKAANEKFQKLNSAYEAVKKERKIA
ncbi:MAG: TerB family tellurite resistance protein [Salinivirgaceae bacterium]|nr:TerB family tellurite resistance protein [Salinivirgaceae bacterium]MDY0280960.1 TerB family tellurite resistance protein [Salinivirgaceae bacterium]